MPSRKLKFPKVFGIGFHKTATTSLAEALTLLGYRVTGPNGVDHPRIAQEAWTMAMELASEYDAFQDNPWPILYRELDRQFPNSKFILTLRPTEAWIQSMVRHFGTNDTCMRHWIYGIGHPQGHEPTYVARYEKHNRDVREYFRNRPEDLLIMDITAGEGWEKLCPFLHCAAPQVPFPMANTAWKRESKNNFFKRWWNRLKSRSISTTNP